MHAGVVVIALRRVAPRDIKNLQGLSFWFVTPYPRR